MIHVYFARRKPEGKKAFVAPPYLGEGSLIAVWQFTKYNNCTGIQWEVCDHNDRGLHII